MVEGNIICIIWWVITATDNLICFITPTLIFFLCKKIFISLCFTKDTTNQKQFLYIYRFFLFALCQFYYVVFRLLFCFYDRNGIFYASAVLLNYNKILCPLRVQNVRLLVLVYIIVCMYSRILLGKYIFLSRINILCLVGVINFSDGAFLFCCFLLFISSLGLFKI